MDLQAVESILSIESRDDLIVARFSIPMILGGEIAEAVGEKLKSLLADSAKRHVLVDFTNVRSVTSLMLGKLVFLSNAAKAQEKSFVLFNVAPNIRKTLEVTRLDRLLSLQDDEAAAIKPLQANHIEK